MLKAIGEKLKKAKKELIKEANEGIQALKGSEATDTKEFGKTIVSQATGIRARLVQEGGKFIKTYLKDNVTKENPTGATFGAFGEYFVKKTVEGIKKGVGTLQTYIESEANRYHKIDAIPELEATRQLMNEYAQDTVEQGKAELNYKGIEIVLEKAEKELSLSLKNKQKTIQLTYMLKGVEISDLNNDLGILTKDLLERLGNLSDPTTVRIDRNTVLKILQKKGEQKYFVHIKKADGTYEVSYTPENTKSGVILKYNTSEVKENGKEL